MITVGDDDSKKGLTMGKGKLPDSNVDQAKPTLKPPVLITPEVVKYIVIFSSIFTIHYDLECIIAPTHTYNDLIFVMFFHFVP